MVAPERLFRVLSGKCQGQILPESEVCICDEDLDGCGGSGVISGSYSGDVRGWDSYADWEDDCPQCDGVGFVLGYPDGGRPVKLVEVTAGEVR